MTTGYVLISVEPRKEETVYKALLKKIEIREMHPVLGEYNFIVKVETPHSLYGSTFGTEDLDEFNRFLQEKIRTLDGVRDTKALIALK